MRALQIDRRAYKMKHNFRKIEGKWQQKWEEAGIFKAVDGSDRPKFYGLVEFP